MSTSPKKNGDMVSEASANNQYPQVLEMLNPSIGFLANPLDNGRIKFFVCEYNQRKVVVLSRADWDLLVKLFEAIERLQVAMGKGFMTVQPIQVAHQVTHRDLSLVVVPLNAWERLVRQVEESSHDCNWELFNLQVEQLKREQKHDQKSGQRQDQKRQAAPPAQLPPVESPLVDTRLGDLSVPETWEQGDGFTPPPYRSK